MTAFKNGFEVLNNKPESNVKFKVLFSENNETNYDFINRDGSDRVKVVVDKKGNKFVSIKKDEEKKLETFFADNKIKDVEIDEGFVNIPLSKFEIKKDFKFSLKAEGLKLNLDATSLNITKGTGEAKESLNLKYDSPANISLSNNYLNDIASGKIIAKDLPVQAIDIIANNPKIFEKNNVDALSLDLAADGENKKLRLVTIDNPHSTKSSKSADKKVTYIYVLNKNNNPIVAQLSSKLKFCLKSDSAKTVTDIRNEIKTVSGREVDNLLENFDQVKFNVVSDLIPNKKSKQKEKDSVGNDTACLIPKLDGEALSKLYHYAEKNQILGSLGKHIDLTNPLAGNYQSVPVEIKDLKQDFNFSIDEEKLKDQEIDRSKDEASEQESGTPVVEEETTGAKNEGDGNLEDVVKPDETSQGFVSEEQTSEQDLEGVSGEVEKTQKSEHETENPHNQHEQNVQEQTVVEQRNEEKQETKKDSPSEKRYAVTSPKAKYWGMGIMLGAFVMISLLAGLAGLISMCFAFGSLAIGMGTILSTEVVADAGAGKLQVLREIDEEKPSKSKSKDRTKDREARKEKRKEKRNERKARRVRRKENKTKEKDDSASPDDSQDGTGSGQTINDSITNNDEQTETYALNEALTEENQEGQSEGQSDNETTIEENPEVTENAEQNSFEADITSEVSVEEGEPISEENPEGQNNVTERVSNALANAAEFTPSNAKDKNPNDLEEYIARLNRETEKQKQEAIDNGTYKPTHNTDTGRE